MIFNSIRSRMLVAALLPVTLVVIVLVAIFWMGRADDVSAAHTERGKLLLRQVTMASEFGLFSGDVAGLEAVVVGLGREENVLAAAVYDAQGLLLAKFGAIEFRSYHEFTRPESLSRQRELGKDTHFSPISIVEADIADPFSAKKVFASKPILGYAVVQMARASLLVRQRELLFLAVGVGALGIFVGGLLGMRLGEGVVRPILDVSRVIERIGKGDYAARRVARADDPLYQLQCDVNHMADRLESARDELEQRVEAATCELNRKKDEAEAANLAKSRFLAAASHDLRQPIHALGMFVSSLGQLPLDPVARKIVTNLEASTHAMQDLLDSLLDLSRLEAGAVPVQISSFDLQWIWNALESALAPTARAKGLRLRVRPTEARVLTDMTLVQRIVMNLAHNALRYTLSGTVLIACRPAANPQFVRIEVWDSGIGISPEHQTEIYKEFYQVGNPARDRSKGLGLGLNIVERSVHLLGLTLNLRSQLHCGTRFSLLVPRAGPDTQLTPATVVDAMADLQGVCALVIEDDLTANEALCALLSSWGCLALSATNGITAKAFLDDGQLPDVIISDFRLGEGDNGLEVIAKLRLEVDRAIPALLMSGDTDSALMHAVQQAELSLLHKPVRPAKLRSLLRRIVTTGLVAVPDLVERGDPLDNDPVASHL
ncbi:MAG: response regulator [Rhodoferax sp.]|nr:response regulator [Rhodoferax sp.]